MAIHSQFSLALKGWSGDHWLEHEILKLSLDKGNKLKEGHGGSLKEGIVCMWKKKGGRWNVRKDFSSYVWRSVHGKGVCKN